MPFSADFDDHVTITIVTPITYVTITIVTRGWSYARENFLLDKQWEVLETSDRELALYHSMAERMAFLWILRRGMKWKAGAQTGVLIPIPDFLEPCDAQCTVAHPAMLDYFPWPALRQRLTLNQKLYCTDTFFLPYMRHIRFSWPDQWQTATTFESQTMVSAFAPEYKQRLGDLASWAVDSDLLHTFPELSDDCVTFQPSPIATLPSQGATTEESEPEEPHDCPGFPAGSSIWRSTTILGPTIPVQPTSNGVDVWGWLGNTYRRHNTA